MKLKYQIQKIEFPDEPIIFVAQYRILGIWMNIGSRGHGYFHKVGDTHCSTILGAKERIQKHQDLMKRSGKWWEKKITTIPYES